MAKDKIVRAVVTAPTFINNVLHYPGEIAEVNLTDLGIDALGKDKDGVDRTPGLAAYDGKGEQLAQVEIAAVAPHAPNPPMPQGIPPGTVPSGTGKLLSPAGDGEDGLAREMVPPEATPPAKGK
jgi:hypothetical protein